MLALRVRLSRSFFPLDLVLRPEPAEDKADEAEEDEDEDEEELEAVDMESSAVVCEEIGL